MAKSFQDRLKHNSRRMRQMNETQSATYKRLDGGEIEGVLVNPILRRSYMLSPSIGEAGVDRQWFTIDVAQLKTNTDEPFFPEQGDILIWNELEYTITPESANMPIWKWTTSLRERVIVHAIRTSLIPNEEETP